MFWGHFGCFCFFNERHAAFWAMAGFDLLDFRMHGARVHRFIITDLLEEVSYFCDSVPGSGGDLFAEFFFENLH